MLIQACQVASPGAAGASFLDPAPVQISDPQQDTHTTLTRPHTVLLLATVRGGTAIRRVFTQAMADQFKSADGKTDISVMYDRASEIMDEGEDSQYMSQCSEFRKTTKIQLILPPASN